MRFTYVVGGPVPPPELLSVECVNEETGESMSPLGVQLGAEAAWLRVTPLTGQTPYGIEVAVQPETLAAGRYMSSIVIEQTAEPIVNPDDTVPVELQVVDVRRPRIQFKTPDNQTFRGNRYECEVVAADDVGVTIVELYVGDPAELVAVQCTHKPDQALPSIISLHWMEDRIPRGDYLLTAKAYNQLGGVAQAQIHVKRV